MTDTYTSSTISELAPGQTVELTQSGLDMARGYGVRGGTWTVQRVAGDGTALLRNGSDTLWFAGEHISKAPAMIPVAKVLEVARRYSASSGLTSEINAALGELGLSLEDDKPAKRSVVAQVKTYTTVEFTLPECVDAPSESELSDWLDERLRPMSGSLSDAVMQRIVSDVSISDVNITESVARVSREVVQARYTD